MAYKKNADGIQQYYYTPHDSIQKIIQKDWLKDHGYKQGQFPPGFFENVEKTLKRGYWAYAIDGDGWIRIKKQKKGRVCKFDVGIKLKDREPVQELADIYGVSIARTDYKNDNWEPSYVTRIHGKRALHFLRLICPYMIVRASCSVRV